MAHNKTQDDVLVVTHGTWHGEHDAVVPEGMDVEDGLEMVRLRDIEWDTRPLYVEISPGNFRRFDRDAIVRLPNKRTPEAHVVSGRVVRDYVPLQNAFLEGLAIDLAKHTGWTFEGAGTFRSNEISFIQLRLPDTYVNNLRSEQHENRFMFGDDKAGNSGHCGLNGTRIQCNNTWNFAIGENTVLRIPHNDDQEARWEFITAQAITANELLVAQMEMLDTFFVTALSKRDETHFIENTFPLPAPTRLMVEAEEAEVMRQSGQTNGYDFTDLFEKAARSREAYLQRHDLLSRRQAGLEQAIAMHNANNPNSADTLFGAFQGLTWMTNHSDLYRGDKLAGLLFGGQRGKDVERGYEVLVEMAEAA